MFNARLLTAPFRVLPDFVIIGAQKCGTTTLYNTLTRHPSVGAASREEVHFFDNEHDRGPLWYRSHFPLAVERWRSRQAGTSAGNSRTFTRGTRLGAPPSRRRRGSLGRARRGR
jgi:hypothetical protein